MCVAIPGKIVSIEDGIGKVDFMGALRRVSLEMIDAPKVGEYVIVHAGCAIERIKEEEAQETIKLFKEIGDLG